MDNTRYLCKVCKFQDLNLRCLHVSHMKIVVFIPGFLIFVFVLIALYFVLCNLRSSFLLDRFLNLVYRWLCQEISFSFLRLGLLRCFFISLILRVRLLVSGFVQGIRVGSCCFLFRLFSLLNFGFHFFLSFVRYRLLKIDYLRLFFVAYVLFVVSLMRFLICCFKSYPIILK